MCVGVALSACGAQSCIRSATTECDWIGQLPSPSFHLDRMSLTRYGHKGLGMGKDSRLY